jgi:hypothetical protein
MSNAYFYAHRLGTQVKTIKQRLGSIGGSSASVAAVPAPAETTTSEE